MAEVAPAGRDHRRAGPIDGGDDLRVAHRAAGLDQARDSRRQGQLGPVGEGEEGVGGERAAGEQVRLRRPAFSTAIRTESTRLICPAPIPTVAPSRASTIAFERTWRHTRQANSRSRHSCSVGRARADDLHVRARLGHRVAVLHQHARRATGLSVGLAGGGGQSRSSSRRTLGFAEQQLQRVVVEAGGEQHLEELLRPATRRSAPSTGRLTAITPPKARLRVAGERALVGLPAGLGDRAAARVVVLDDHARRPLENSSTSSRAAFEVQQVVERELLALAAGAPRRAGASARRPARSRRRAGAGSRRSAGRDLLAYARASWRGKPSPARARRTRSRSRRRSGPCRRRPRRPGAGACPATAARRRRAAPRAPAP